jgi:hypothetical protein
MSRPGSRPGTPTAIKHERVRVYARIKGKSGGVVFPTSSGCEVKVPGRGRFPFVLDGCFGAGLAGDQEDVYETVGKPVLLHALSGFNASVLSYGATGSGKTYSVFGSGESAGLVPRLCNDLFAARSIEAMSVTLSIVEIYMEDVFDLLNDRRELKVRRTESGNFEIADAKQACVSTYHDIVEQLRVSERSKTVAATAIHERSSRAHTLCELTILQRRRGGDQSSKIVIADLAGSERVKTAGTGSGTPLSEACNINLSLLTLGRCIEAVAANKNAVGEFRNSTLTKLLKDYIGGNSVTTMLVTIAPSLEESNNTVQTLRFADRARRLQSRVRENVVNPSSSEKLENHDHSRRKDLLNIEMECEQRLEAAQHEVLMLESKCSNCDNSEMFELLESAACARDKAEEDLERIRRESYPREYALRNALEQLRNTADSLRDQVDILDALELVRQSNSEDVLREVESRNCELEDEVERLKRRCLFFEEELHLTRSSMDQKVERLEAEKNQLFLHLQLAQAAHADHQAEVRNSVFHFVQASLTMGRASTEMFCEQLSRMAATFVDDSSKLALSAVENSHDSCVKSLSQLKDTHDQEMEEVGEVFSKLQTLTSQLKLKAIKRPGLAVREAVNYTEKTKL